jgi:long-chain acyl-CoA synthetase
MEPHHSDIIHDLLNSLKAGGAQDAIITFEDDGPSKTLSYAALDGLVGGFAHALGERGLGGGVAVAILAENGIAAIVARLSLLSIGAVAVNLDPDASLDELRRELKISGSKSLIATQRYLEPARSMTGGSVPVLTLDREELERCARLKASTPVTVTFDDAAALFFTSGTTGPPKAVPLTRRNISATIHTVKELKLIGQNDRIFLPLPLHHSYPFLIGLLVTLASGATLVLPAALTGPQLAHAIRDGRVSVIVGVPRLYEALWQSIEAQLHARGAVSWRLFESALGLSSFVQRLIGLPLGRLLFRPLHRRLGPRLRIFASGGARLDARIAARLVGLGFVVLEGYGLVETASVSTFNPPGRARLGSVGLPAPDVEIRIDEPDREGQGEILIRGPGVFPGYLHDAEATARAFARGGWFRSGDLGRRDRDGYLYITGRLKEIIVLPDGKKIAPEELEAVYSASPFVGEIALLETREGLQALVVPNVSELGKVSASPENAIRVALAEIGQALPPYQRLSGFALRHEPLPRTHLGKYARRALPALFEQARRHERKPSAQMTDADQLLLEDPLARALWNWLHERFSGQAFDLETSPQLDLGIDSLGWVELGLAIQKRFNVALPEETISRIVTLRDLIKAVRDVAQSAPTKPRLEEALEEAEAWVAAPSPWRVLVAQLMLGIVRLSARLFFHLRAYGVENIPSSRPLIIAANHASDLDPLMLAASLPYAILKDAYWGGDAARLFSSPVRRWFSRTVHVFPIDDRAPAASLARARAILDKGKILLWFPESWRSPNGALQRFLPGIIRLLREQGALVVPAHISGTFDALPRQARIPRFVPIKVRFGQPLSLSAVEELAADATDPGLAEALRRQVAVLA